MASSMIFKLWSMTLTVAVSSSDRRCADDGAQTRDLAIVRLLGRRRVAHERGWRRRSAGDGVDDRRVGVRVATGVSGDATGRTAGVATSSVWSTDV